MNVSTLLAEPDSIGLVSFISNADSITIVVRANQKTVCCPLCNTPSGSLNSNYIRRIANLPWHGVAIGLELRARKFRCRNELCSQKVFCERFEKVAAPFARRTVRLDQAIPNALSSVWSNGQTKGQVNRLKTIKRAIYGRANFDLLRVRVLYRAK